eukprot:TRINITY_DN4483_c0_g1_i5.p1 TRINITY_DN4483_c0_g1~~TRINITY_DN4483_c0_g1_i5.p1  ORF type:complete len:386 (+),score=68.06 TRINITY_DN4483_c0_g1_i5:58-1215(+)
MEPYKSTVNTKSQEFKKNYETMMGLVTDLNQKLASSLYEGEKHYIERHRQKGKLTARERIDLLLDEDSPFLELSPLAGLDIQRIACISGIGIVSGIECIIMAHIPTIRGGSINEYTARRWGRADAIAIDNHLPCLLLVESGGADLNEQAKVFHYGGAGFKHLTQRSKQGVPTISVVFGNSTAGGAYTPGMSDYVIMVKNQAKVFLGGPPLVKMATGEVTDDESLGGATMHSKVSGVSDYLAEDEYHAIRLAREVMSSLNYKKKTPFPSEYFGSIEEPIYDPNEILGIASADVRVPYDSREVIARLVDGSKFHEFKPLYGSTMVTCWAKIHGFPVGILANNGVIFSATANKATQFIQLCDRRGIPLLFLHNVTDLWWEKSTKKEAL